MVQLLTSQLAYKLKELKRNLTHAGLSLSNEAEKSIRLGIRYQQMCDLAIARYTKGLNPITGEPLVSAQASA